MYTKSELQSKKYMILYESVARRSLKDLSFVEGFLVKKRKKRNLKIDIEDKHFETNENNMHYTGKVHTDNNDKYINIDVSKEIGNDLLNIILTIGTTGYDIHSGERYDRQFARVSYTYKDKVNIDLIKTEDEIANEEEARLKECNLKVKELTRNKKIVS